MYDKIIGGFKNWLNGKPKEQINTDSNANPEEAQSKQNEVADKIEAAKDKAKSIQDQMNEIQDQINDSNLKASGLMGAEQQAEYEKAGKLQDKYNALKEQYKREQAEAAAEEERLEEIRDRQMSYTRSYSDLMLFCRRCREELRNDPRRKR
jgi:chromosome segregation ATPase